MSGRRTAYTAAWVLPMSSPPIRDGVVVVDGARIAHVGRADDAPERWADAVHVPLGYAALLPGLVNAHSHLELTALRGFLEGLDFRDWLRTLTAVRRDLLVGDALLDSARAGVHEALRNGITTCADTSASGVPLAAMRQEGLRGIGYLETFGPDPVQAPASIAALRQALDAHRVHDTPLVRTGVSPHAPYTVSAALFREVAALARSESVPVAVHIAESVAERDFVRAGSGSFADGLRARGIAVAGQARSPVALLEETGLLAARPLLIHAIQTDDEDLQAVRDAGATIVHCPISNAKLGHGIAPLDRMRTFGVPTGLGTDSVASNDRMDMLGEARQATLFQSVRLGRPDALSAHEALWLATAGGAAALGLDGAVGTLEAGKQADLAAFPLDGDDVGPVHDPAVTLVHVLAGSVRARLVLVAGVRLVQEGVLTRQDAALTVRGTEFADRLREWRTR